MFALVLTSHIDDDNGELSTFTYDKVVFRLQKDCSLDRMQGMRKWLEEETAKYPDLEVFLSEGEPRFELLKSGEVVDTIRVGKYDVPALRKLARDLGLKREESQTWEKRKAVYQMEKAFKEADTKVKAEL